MCWRDEILVEDEGASVDVEAEGVMQGGRADIGEQEINVQTIVSREPRN